MYFQRELLEFQCSLAYVQIVFKVLSTCEVFLAENKDLVLICEGFEYL